jgi:hypothetical protein
VRDGTGSPVAAVLDDAGRLVFDTVAGASYRIAAE